MIPADYIRECKGDGARMEDEMNARKHTEQTLTFSADHVSPDYRFDHAVARIGYDTSSGRYYADAAKLGCSKSYATPRDALRAMLHDHACTQVIIHDPMWERC